MGCPALRGIRIWVVSYFVEPNARTSLNGRDRSLRRGVRIVSMPRTARILS
jgi:hypothetical protein